MCWEEAQVWHWGKWSMHHPKGHQVCFGRDPRIGLGDHRALHAEGSGWDGGQLSYSSSFSKPSLPDEDGDDKNSSQDEEGKDPKGYQDGHLFQGVTVICNRETVRAEGCNSPQHLGNPVASSWTLQQPSHIQA